MDIHHFLALPHRFKWGGAGGEDCMTFPARWAYEVMGVDPADDLRGTYRSKAEAEAIIAEHGGMQSMMDEKLTAIGAKRVQTPQTGDIGLVVMMAGENYDDAKMTEVGAIRFGRLWASTSPGGVRAKEAVHIAVWRLPG